LVGRLEAVDRVVAEFDERGKQVKDGGKEGRPNQSCRC
jgi:hypothetical protein